MELNPKIVYGLIAITAVIFVIIIAGLLYHLQLCKKKSSGTQVVSKEKFAFFDVVRSKDSVIGPTGPKRMDGVSDPMGSRGITGAPGERGSTGPKGSKGDAGVAGLIGPKGDAGGQKGEQVERGPTGPKGSKGDAGVINTTLFYTKAQIDDIVNTVAKLKASDASNAADISGLKKTVAENSAAVVLDFPNTYVKKTDQESEKKYIMFGDGDCLTKDNAGTISLRTCNPSNTDQLWKIQTKNLPPSLQPTNGVFYFGRNNIQYPVSNITTPGNMTSIRLTASINTGGKHYFQVSIARLFTKNGQFNWVDIIPASTSTEFSCGKVGSLVNEPPIDVTLSIAPEGIMIPFNAALFVRRVSDPASLSIPVQNLPDVSLIIHNIILM